MKLRTLVPLLLAAAATGNALPPLLAPEESPHAAAIRLVMRERAHDIRAIELSADPAEGSWWFDTKERTWSARRPFGPGIFDSRHYFEVTYAVDGKVEGSWRTNTRHGEVGGAGENVRVE